MINTAVRRISPAVSLVAVFIALLALVAAVAGAGYAAGTIGAKDLKKNSVTSAKIKKNAVTAKKIKSGAVTSDKVADGSLGVSDLVAQEAQHAAALSNGGEGDCVWQSGAAVIPGLGGPTFRKDRFGTVHLTGIAIVSDGAGGDGVCDPSDPGQTSDAIAFTLPAGYVPSKTLLIPVGISGGAILIAGPQGIAAPGLFLPPGSVADALGGGGAILLDGLDFEPAGSNVVLAKGSAKGSLSPELLAQFGLN
jgi:hypothetical protein